MIRWGRRKKFNEIREEYKEKNTKQVDKQCRDEKNKRWKKKKDKEEEGQKI